MAFGARHARGDWFLFTDADTIHKPGSLARAVSEAERHGADLLSYSPQQIVKSFWERALMPVVFAELAATFKPREVSDPRSSVGRCQWPILAGAAPCLRIDRRPLLDRPHPAGRRGPGALDQRGRRAACSSATVAMR